jgi:hypothetical protein
LEEKGFIVLISHGARDWLEEDRERGVEREGEGERKRRKEGEDESEGRGGFTPPSVPSPCESFFSPLSLLLQNEVVVLCLSEGLFSDSEERQKMSHRIGDG